MRVDQDGVDGEVGISIMPLSSLELELETGRLITLRVEGFPVFRHWSLARRSGSHLSAAALSLWNFLLAYRDEVMSRAQTAALPPHSMSTRQMPR